MDFDTMGPSVRLVSHSDIASVRLDLTTALHANPKWLDRAFGSDRLLHNLSVGVEPVSYLVKLMLDFIGR